MAATPKKSPWSQVRSKVGIITGARFSKLDTPLAYASAALGTSAAVLQSSFLATLLTFAPADEKLFAVSIISAGLRIVCLLLAVIGDPAARTSPKAAAVNACRLGSSIAVNAAALLPQPLFTTIVGGAFTSGDASKVLTLRLGRALWGFSAAAEALPAGVSALFLYYAFKKPAIDDTRLHAAYLAGAAAAGYAAFWPSVTAGDESDGSAIRIACLLLALALLAATLVASVLGAIAGRAGAKTVPAHFVLPSGWKAAKTVYKAVSGVAAALFVGASWKVVRTFGYLHAFERFSGVDLGAALASVPSALLVSRQELALLHTTFERLPAVLLIVGDVMLNTATMPATLGVLGAALVRLALLASGLEPLAGFYLVASAWAAKLATEWVGVLAGVPETAIKYTVGPRANLKVDEGKPLKKGSAALELKVLGSASKVLGKTLKLDDALYYLLGLLVLVQLCRQPLYSFSLMLRLALYGVAAGVLYKAKTFLVALPDKALHALFRYAFERAELASIKATAPLPTTEPAS